MDTKNFWVVKFVLAILIASLAVVIFSFISIEVNFIYFSFLLYVLLDVFEVRLRVFLKYYYFFIKNNMSVLLLPLKKLTKKWQFYLIDSGKKSVRVQKLDFVIYFDAPENSKQQVLMWLPYLKLLNKSYAIILRRKYYYYSFFKQIKEPVLLCRSIREIEKSIKKYSFRSVFYVNNAECNTHMVKFSELTHVQLLHGESDKPPSYNPVSQMYDFIFVSGKTAKDRYRYNGVNIPEYKFKFVSRPQCSDVLIEKFPVLSSKNFKGTVFYTTTWSGYDNGSNFTSIHEAEKIVRILLKKSYRIIFRPHPYSYKDFSQVRIINKIASILLKINKREGLKTSNGHCVVNHSKFDSTYENITDCINSSDCLLSDISSTVGDWLYSLKPYILIDTFSDRNQFLNNNSLSRAAYYFDLYKGDLFSLLDEIQVSDSLKEDRKKLKIESLTVNNEESPIDLFVKTTLDVLDSFDKAKFIKDLPFESNLNHRFINTENGRRIDN